MPVFDQRYQQVNYQYNVNGMINFDNVQSRVDVVGELKKLQSEVAKATESGALDGEVSTDIKAKIEKAIIQAQKPEPNKKTIMDYLKEARSLLTDIVVVAGLAEGISEAIEIVRKFF